MREATFFLFFTIDPSLGGEGGELHFAFSVLIFALIVGIPHFKEVVIMATTCDHCGHKTNEVKSGGGIEPRGTKITLKVTDPSDMSRDVLKVRDKLTRMYCL